ncbi:MAG: hypothetical protein HYZ75_10725 [Elusimicrobia bacterium]|nr:hypothetical protein [Elusimicrobiota bacterium]
MTLAALTSPFVLRELLRPSLGRRSRVGWVLPRLWPYRSADASTRLRAYDLWGPLNALGVSAELYRPFLNYGAVVFQKAFEPHHLALARRLRAKGVKIVLDLNVNYVDFDPEFAPEYKRRALDLMLPETDALIVSSGELERVYRGRVPRVVMVPDPVPAGLFPSAKVHAGTRGLRLVYCGYAVKAREVLAIAPVLRRVCAQHDARVLFVCEKDPKLPGLPSEFKRYSQRSLAAAFAAADIAIAPRDLSRPYNLGHSAVKVALPMAAGLPAVASPVPSYEGSPALLCRSDEEWESALTSLILDPERRAALGAAGRVFARRELDVPVVAARYAAALRQVLLP